MFSSTNPSDSISKKSVNKKRLVQITVAVGIVAVIVVAALIALPFVYRAQLQGVWIHQPSNVIDTMAIIEIKGNEAVYASERGKETFKIDGLEWKNVSGGYMLSCATLANSSKCRNVKFIKKDGVETLWYGFGNMYDYERLDADYTLLD